MGVGLVKVKVKSLSHVWVFATPWTRAHQAPLSLGFSVHGILQARILEWVAISFSRRSSLSRDQTQVSRIAGRCFNLWAPREAQGVMRSLQPPDVLWIHWRVYNSISNTSKWVLFLPPSDVYVRSFVYLLYTLIKLYYTKALRDQASSLAPDWILLLQRPRIRRLFEGQEQTFSILCKWPH